MDIEAFLSSIVEISVGIVGFAGIIAAVQRRGMSGWPAPQRILMQVLCFASAMAIVFALLPSALAEAGVENNLIWKIGSCGLLIWYAGILPYRRHQARKFGVLSQIPRLLQIWVLTAAALQIYNLTTPGLSWPYMFGVFSLVVNGFTVFLLLLLGSGATDQETS
jgi:hypothetical protein